MNLQAFQPGELRNGMDEIIRPGAYGKKTAFATADNNGILDYIMNNFEVLKDALSGAYIYAANLSKFPLTGSSDKLYVAEDTGQTYKWNGSAYVLLTSPINGKSAYEIACDNGFTGTAKEWLASIGAETVDAVSVDEAGYLTFHLHSGGTLTAPMKPVIEAAASASQAKSWAESESSPDGGADSDSSTGKTQSSKAWALYSKDRATAAASSASASASSASAAKTSQSDAASSASAASSSASAASTSATNAKNSQTAAASSASAAKSSQTAAATSETNAKTALVSCQNIQTQVNNGLQSLTSAVKYRGSVASFSVLPTSGQSVGDMYNIKAAGGTDANGTVIRAGDNVVWNGSGWDDQAGTVDLSNYYTKSEVNGAVVSATVSDATITFIHKDASKSTATVNNVGHATKASQDDKGQAIDVAALKTLITTTVNDAVLQCKKDLYPVGSVYVSITDSRNPADILGFGTWEALPAGYGLVAQGTATAEDGSTLTFTAGQKSGEFKHQLTVGELPKIEGRFPGVIFDSYQTDISGIVNFATGFSKSLHCNKNQTEYGYNISFGNNKYHNNLAPYVACYLWQRTA
ncbi:phage baseplate protein [Megasphaera elsdenii]|uniref:phage baseplate protein n=1 Tax=Megasphaera elsdenii TaxID=907 RepID=UPI003CFE74C3